MPKVGLWEKARPLVFTQQTFRLLRIVVQISFAEKTVFPKDLERVLNTRDPTPRISAA